MKNYITTDKLKQTAKPIGGAIAKINSHLKHVVEVTPESFLEMVTQPNGYSFTPAIFNGKRSNKNWKEQSVFALDYDGGITPEEVVSAFEGVGITPNVYYSSFSDTPELRKFRMVFFLDTVITNKKLRDFIQKGLMTVVECDKACKDAARLYFGGIEGEVLNSDPINLQTMFDSVGVSTMTSDSNKTRKIDPNLLSSNELEDNSKTVPQRYPNSIIYRISSEDKNEGGVQIDLHQLITKVGVVEDFANGVWLTHPELFGLATNLHWVRGGIKFMKDTMDKWNAEGKTQYTQNNYNILNYVRKMKYKPTMLKNFSPYEEDHKYHNLLDVHWKVGKVNILDKEEKITLEEAEKLLSDTLSTVLASDDTKVHLFKLPTAIGKTRELTKLKGVTIAMPTNALKDEVYDRMETPALKTPATPILSDSQFQEKLEALYNAGFTKQANNFLRMIANSNTKDSEAIKQYFRELRGVYNTKHNVVTTHTRAMFSEFKHDTIIFDEDPINSILSIGTVEIGEIVKLNDITQRGLFDNPDEIEAVEMFMRATSPRTVVETPVFDIDINEWSEKIILSKAEGNMVEFFDSDYLMRDDNHAINYINRRELPDKKIIIMSASASVEIYRRLLGDRLVVHDIMNVEQVGSVIQHTSRSYSRTSIANHISKLNKELDGNPTITFGHVCDKVKGGVTDMYFGNVSGYDELKGKDINVVGTPHMNPAVYLLTAMVLGIKFKTSDTAMSYQIIKRNGMEFKFMTYDNEELRDIQLGMIEGELMQAVGRARTLREDCTVNLYSNLPLRVTTQFNF